MSTALWYASRATGVVTLVLLSAVVVLGVLVNRQGRLPGLPRFAVTGLHRSISLIAVVFLAVHVLTAVADKFVTIQLIAAIIPFTSSYLPLQIGLGAVALDLIIAVIITSLLRARIGRRVWRGVHWLAYAAYPVAACARHHERDGPAVRWPARAHRRLRAQRGRGRLVPAGCRRPGPPAVARRGGGTARGRKPAAIPNGCAAAPS